VLGDSEKEKVNSIWDLNTILFQMPPGKYFLCIESLMATILSPTSNRPKCHILRQGNHYLDLFLFLFTLTSPYFFHHLSTRMCRKSVFLFIYTHKKLYICNTLVVYIRGTIYEEIYSAVNSWNVSPKWTRSYCAT
jgi:hypothetical protein